MKKKKLKQKQDEIDELEEPQETEEVYSDPNEGEITEDPLDNSNDVENLRAEISLLKEELEAKKREGERLFSEIAELALTFPYITLDSIAEEVWQSSREGIPLAAAYALYEKKRQSKDGYAKEINERNAARSSGALKGSGDGGYYTPSEVRQMSPAEVKKNYKFIIESMKKWN